jgi:hypothetical protein
MTAFKDLFEAVEQMPVTIKSQKDLDAFHVWWSLTKPLVEDLDDRHACRLSQLYAKELKTFPEPKTLLEAGTIMVDYKMLVARENWITICTMHLFHHKNGLLRLIKKMYVPRLERPSSQKLVS